MKILLVDDKAENLLLLEAFLRRNGYTTVTAANGAEALATALKSPPDMVVSDIFMPVMDGFVLCREWKKNKMLQKIPFVFYTSTYTDPKDEEFALSLGADRFIVKPQDLSAFLQIIQETYNTFRMKTRQPMPAPAPEEKVFLKEYSEALVRKLEDKTLHLEAANKELKEKNAALEKDIAELKRAEEALAGSEMKYRQLVSRSPDGIFIIDLSGKFLSVNRAMCDILKYTEEEFLSMNMWDFVPEQYQSLFKQRLMAIMNGESTNTAAVYEAKGKDGVAHFIEVLSAPYHKGEKIVGFQGIARDITERLRTQQQLTLLGHTLKSVAECVCITDTNDTLLFANNAFLKTYGYREEEILGKNVNAVRSPDNPPETARKVLAGTLGGGWSGELLNRAKDGREFPVSLSTSCVRDEDGQVVALVGVATDITERKRAEKALQEGEERLRILFEYAPDAYYLNDFKGTFIDGNKAAEELMGYSRAELVGKNFLKLNLLSGPQMVKAASLLVQNALGKPTGPSEFTLRRKNGSLVEVEIRTFPTKIKDQRLVLGIARDITERKRREESLHLQSMALNAAANSIMITDRDGAIEWVNSAFTALTGYTAEEAVGKNPRELVKSGKHDQAVYKQLWDTILGGEVWRGELINRRKDGSLYTEGEIITPVRNVDGKISHIIAIKEDITERKRVAEALVASEIKYRAFFENSMDAILLTAPDGKVLSANPAACNMFGYSEKELINSGRSGVVDVTDPRLSPLLSERDLIGKARGEVTLIRKGGTRFPAEISSAIFRNYEGQVYTSMIIRDTTERKRTEEAIRESEQQFRSVWDHSADGMRLTNETGQIIEVNESYCRLVNMTRDNLVGQFLSVVYKTRGPHDNLNLYSERFISGKVDSHISAPAILWDGRSIELEISSSYIGDRGGNERCLSIFRDITERKKTEKINGALSLLGFRLSSAESSVQASRIIAEVADQLFGWDACLVDYYLAEQDSIVPILNIDSMNGNRFDAAPTDLSQKPTERMRQILKKGSQLILREEGGGFTSDTVPFGDISRPSASLMFVPIHHGAETIGVFSIQSYTFNKYNENDLATLQGLADHCGGAFARIRAQDELKVQTSNFRQLFENSPYGITLLDDKNNVVDANRSFTDLFQFRLNDIKGRNLDDFIVPNDLLVEAREYGVNLSKGEIVLDETERKRKDGRLVNVLITANPVNVENKQAGFFILYLDITERVRGEETRKNLEEQLQQAQRLESIGTLASGIAHDFNNILGLILGYSTLLERLREDPKEFQESVEAIIQATQRGASLVKQLLIFARKTDALFETVSLNDVIGEISKVLKETFPKTITISTNLQQDLPTIVADAGQIHQVLLNLCVNARDAMPIRGTLSISTKIVESESVGSRFTKAIGYAAARQYVEIEVADTGIGMDESTRQRIFEPFFTTKGPGKGTGLGLSVVFGIVKHHSGFIDVRSAPGEGTSFSVYLPIPERTLEEVLPARKGLEEIPRGTETILIIEDEEKLRELLRASLVSKGYTVLTAEDGMQGVEMYRSHQKEIALVLSDIGLPALSGQDVFKRIREINPEAKVIFASGFFDPESKSEMYKAGLKDFIQKPYLQNEVLRRVRKAIDTNG